MTNIYFISIQMRKLQNFKIFKSFDLNSLEADISMSWISLAKHSIEESNLKTDINEIPVILVNNLSILMSHNCIMSYFKIHIFFGLPHNNPSREIRIKLSDSEYLISRFLHSEKCLLYFKTDSNCSMIKTIAEFSQVIRILLHL